MATSSAHPSSGIVRAIAHRPTDGRPMTEAAACTVVAGRGIDLENRKSGRREVTLLSEESWAEACRELGQEIPWLFRRANFLISGIDLKSTIGGKIFLGEVCVLVHGETKPCGIMDQQHPGLREALEPRCRGGVYGQVLDGGTVRVGDRVRLADPTP